jgi:hypothetical protein
MWNDYPHARLPQLREQGGDNLAGPNGSTSFSNPEYGPCETSLYFVQMGPAYPGRILSLCETWADS